MKDGAAAISSSHKNRILTGRIISVKMNKYLLATTALFLCLLAFSAAMGAGSAFRIYLDNREIPVKTIIKDGELYINVNDLSQYSSGTMKLDPKNGRLDLFSQSSGREAAGEGVGQTVPDKGITGSISLKDNGGKEFFLKNVKVILFAYDKDIPDEVSLAQLKKYASGDSNEYTGTHGKVREMVTDAGGRFFVAGVAPGKYEIVSIYYNNGGKKGILWRSIISMGKDGLEKIDFNTDNAIKF